MEASAICPLPLSSISPPYAQNAQLCNFIIKRLLVVLAGAHLFSACIVYYA